MAESSIAGKPDPRIAAYAWADAVEEVRAITLVLLRPSVSQPPQSVRVLEELRLMTFSEGLRADADLVNSAWGSQLLQLDQVDGWTALIQPLGWGLSLPGVAASLSPDGDVVSLFWNINAVMSVTVAQYGQVVRYFDPLIYDDVDPRLPEEAGLPFGVDHPRASALTFAERRTGVHIAEAWLLQRPRTTYRVADPPRDAT